MTLAQLKAAIDELSMLEKPDTPVDIFLWSGREVEVGRVMASVDADGYRAILIHEK